MGQLHYLSVLTTPIWLLLSCALASGQPLRTVDPTFLHRYIPDVSPKSADVTSDSCEYKPLFGAGDSVMTIVRGVARFGQMALEINSDTIAEAVVSRLKDSAVLAPRLLTLNQAAMYLGMTPDALKAKVHMGRVPTVDIDKKLRFDKLDLDRIIEESKKVA
jgi:hypothetical protein